jgi:hypothetical protein
LEVLVTVAWIEIVRGLTYQAHRRAAPMLTSEKPYTGPSGSAQGYAAVAP